jgi:hypothetical protein
MAVDALQRCPLLCRRDQEPQGPRRDDRQSEALLKWEIRHVACNEATRRGRFDGNGMTRANNQGCAQLVGVREMCAFTLLRHVPFPPPTLRVVP